MKNIVVWHRRDLRTHDNKALSEAHKNGRVIPVFVIDPFFFESREGHHMTNNDRIEFMFESLKDLDRQYREKGTHLTILYGESIESIERISEKIDAEVYFNKDTNMPYARKRDIQAYKEFKAFDNDAIQRSGRKNKWHQNCRDFFESDEFEEPGKMHGNDLVSEVSFDYLREKYNIRKEKEEVSPGGTQEALKRLEKFKELISEYTKSISKPILSEEGTSRLSSHFSFGTISLRRVYKEVSKVNAKQRGFFKTRLFWNQHFTQKLEDNPDLVTEAANPVFEQNYDKMYEKNEDRIKAWKEGKTGFPLVDASMRALVKTGFINFRMRAMVASFFTYIMKQPWKIGADFMFYHLIDADVAINYSQWQMQSGLVGVHPNRIYNPTKQILDNDPDCKFIKKYVPELRGFSNEFIKQEPMKSQSKLTGETYIKPIVDFKKERDKAIKIYKELNEKARDYLKRDPQLLNKLSLSNRARSRNKKPETKEV